MKNCHGICLNFSDPCPFNKIEQATHQIIKNNQYVNRCYRQSGFITKDDFDIERMFREIDSKTKLIQEYAQKLALQIYKQEIVLLEEN